MAVNVDLIRRIADRIDNEPERYNQLIFIDVDESRVEWTEDGGDVVPTPAIDCGTAFCIAGWAMAESGYQFDPGTDEWITPYGGIVENEVRAGAALLGLDLLAGATLFDGEWKPTDGLTPGDALRLIADSDGSLDAVNAVSREFL